jgi:hypothetical protein
MDNTGPKIAILKLLKNDIHHTYWIAIMIKYSFMSIVIIPESSVTCWNLFEIWQSLRR